MKISLPTAFYYPKCFARILVEFSSENLSEFPAVTYANLSEGDPDYRWWVDGLEKPRCMETSWRDEIYDKRRIRLHGKRLVLVGIIFVLWLSRIDRTHLVNCKQQRQPQRSPRRSPSGSCVLYSWGSWLKKQTQPWKQSNGASGFEVVLKAFGLVHTVLQEARQLRNFRATNVLGVACLLLPRNFWQCDDTVCDDEMWAELTSNMLQS